MHSDIALILVDCRNKEHVGIGSNCSTYQCSLYPWVHNSAGQNGDFKVVSYIRSLREDAVVTIRLLTTSNSVMSLCFRKCFSSNCKDVLLVYKFDV